MSKHIKIAIVPQVVEVIDVDTTPEAVLEAAKRAEKLLIKGMKRGKGTPTMQQTLLLFINLIRSSILGELRFDIEEEEVAEILQVLLFDEPGYTFSSEFPYTREQILANMAVAE